MAVYLNMNDIRLVRSPALLLSDHRLIRLVEFYWESCVKRVTTKSNNVLLGKKGEPRGNMGDNNNSADRKRQLQLWVSPSRSAPQGGCLAGPRMLDVCSPGSHKSLAIRGRRGYPVFTVLSCDRATGTRRELTLRRYIYIYMFALCPCDDFDDYCIRFKGCVSTVCNCQSSLQDVKFE